MTGRSAVMNARPADQEGSRPRGTHRLLRSIGALSCILALVTAVAVHASPGGHHHRHQVALAATFGDVHAATTRADHHAPSVSSNEGFPAPRLVAAAAIVHGASAVTSTVDSSPTRGPPAGL